ncbi:MAG: Pyruvate synthase subunit PorD [Candidatus Methanolliviera sp. GoM_asphalt]|nr:MAG: Pyruvate synthase subunit PorD [Candidatus Methanolliviera sp. GoM_asphalt]
MKLLPGGIVKPKTTVVNKTGAWRTFIPVFDEDKCKKCGICETFCPEDCISIDENEFRHPDYDFCKGCGICAEECPADAIEMKYEEKE